MSGIPLTRIGIAPERSTGFGELASMQDPDKSQWFAEEVHPHESSLRAYLRGSFPAVRDLDDIVQESYLRIWTARATQPIRSGKAFLFRVARNLALDFVRRRKNSPVDTVQDLSAFPAIEEGPSAAEAACTNQELAILAEAIDSLPGRCREIVVLRKLRGISQKEIAAQLGISEQTVQVQAARGIRRCEKFLRQRGIKHGSRSTS